LKDTIFRVPSASSVYVRDKSPKREGSTKILLILAVNRVNCIGIV